jgi:hypothetical protein
MAVPWLVNNLSGGGKHFPAAFNFSGARSVSGFRSANCAHEKQQAGQSLKKALFCVFSTGARFSTYLDKADSVSAQGNTLPR